MTTLLEVCDAVMVVVVAVVPPALNNIFLVASTESTMDVDASTRDLLVSVSVVSVPTKVVVASGKVTTLLEVCDEVIVVVVLVVPPALNSIFLVVSIESTMDVDTSASDLLERV